MTKLNFITILTFISVCLIGAIVVWLTDGSCNAILQYNWTNQFGVESIFRSLMKIGVISILGIGFFQVIKRRIQPRKRNLVYIFYFAVLPLFIFYKQFLLIPQNLLNTTIKESICQKSVTNGMTTTSKNISLTEYGYLKNQFFLLPELPKTSHNISLNYYTDNFLGDYSLSINFTCENKEQIDTKNKHWTILNIDKLTNRKSIEYFDQEN